MPLISGFVGYITNVIALKMTFYPLEFWPLKVWQPEDQPFGLFGWQGIIPAKAGKMASKSVDLMTEKLINVNEVFQRIDPARFAEVMEGGLFEMMTQIITDVGTNKLPKGVWDSLPEAVQHETIFKALDDSPEFLNAFMTDIKDDVEQVFDLKHMVVTAMVANKELLNRVFMECGAQELTFIERSGFYFGFLFGIAQMVWWYYFQEIWVLPFCGLIVGTLTNWIALKVIFLPIEPTPICCGAFTMHGLFLQRQDAVSELFAKINAESILYPEAMWTSILTGPRSDKFRQMLDRHTHQFVDKMAGKLKPFVKAYLGEMEFLQMKDDIAAQIMEELPKHIYHSYDYTAEALKMEDTLCTAMKGLTYLEFEGVLHPVFEEDELKLILVGALLGAMVGVFQLLVMFGGVENETYVIFGDSIDGHLATGCGAESA
mmetsp:Transcript_70961/g.199027  ORF Transcript_70961/g.199027 Transcript_70961/m.199027 type:complete len:430 (+) Transcript_70961:3866-5155(+)